MNRLVWVPCGVSIGMGLSQMALGRAQVGAILFAGGAIATAIACVAEAIGKHRTQVVVRNYVTQDKVESQMSDGPLYL